MTRVEGTVYRETRCRSCGTTSKGTPEATLSPGVVLAYCVGCRRKMPAEDLGPTTIVEPTRREGVDVFIEAANLGEELGEPSTPYAAGFLPAEVRVEPLDPEAFGRPRAVETSSGLCPDCQELGVHDDGCPHPDRIQRAYREWRATPDGLAVVAAIRRRAVELRRRGWRRYGIQALAEVARFDRSLSAGPDVAGYKVNNSHLSRLARDLMDEDPELRGFFEIRVLSSERDQ